MLAILAMAVLNRMRGGGLWADRLPGHPRFWCAPVVASLALVVSGDAVVSLWFAVAWLGWSLVPWGDIYMLGRARPDGGVSWPFLDSIAGLFAIGLFPALALLPLSAWSLVLAPAMPLSYIAGWAAFERWPVLRAHTPVAEPMMGAAWGVILLTL